jgi:hypothetical protein
LILELVDGEHFGDRICRGAIPLDEALPPVTSHDRLLKPQSPVARQSAEALEAAHAIGSDVLNPEA